MDWGVPEDYASAHMWFDLATTKGDGLAAKARNLVAAKMTAAQSLKRRSAPRSGG
jgi:hypothetical protein